MNASKLLVGMLVAMLLAGLIVMVSPKMMAEETFTPTIRPHYSTNYQNA